MRDSLIEHGYRFEFFQAVRLFERLYADREPVGYTAHPSREVARFGARLSLTFPASEIHEVVPPEDDNQPVRMIVNFMGLTGPTGVLPHSYTELLQQRVSQKDYTLCDFLDLFNHRMISLFYRAWEKYRFPIAYERDPEARFSQYLSDLIGMGTPGLKARLAVSDEALYFYAGLLNQRPRSACGLEGILRDYFQLPAETDQFIGRWVRLEPDNQSRLAVQNTTLGQNVILGESVWDRQSKFRVGMGPLCLTAFRSLLPCGGAFKELTQMVRLYAGMEDDFDMKLILKAEEVPPCQLLSEGETGAHLGWSSWLKLRDFTTDAKDTVLASRN